MLRPSTWRATSRYRATDYRRVAPLPSGALASAFDGGWAIVAAAPAGEYFQQFAAGRWVGRRWRRVLANGKIELDGGSAQYIVAK